MAQSCECDNCDFSFLGGHSHDAGYSDVICVNCLSKFVLPTKSNWGPKIGETIELREIKIIQSASKKERNSRNYRPAKILVPTGVCLVVEESEKSNGMATYSLDVLTCPKCNTKASLKGYFKNKQLCPQCGVGSLECHNDVEF